MRPSEHAAEPGRPASSTSFTHPTVLTSTHRHTTTFAIVLCLAVPHTGASQVPAPAVVFARASDAPATVAWSRPAERADRAAGGAIFGALVGAGVGFVVGQAGCSSCDDAAPVLAVTGLGAALGAVIGFVIGLRSPDA